MLNVFETDAYGVVSLTNSINKLPYKPSRLGTMKLFTPVPITTDVAVVEEKQGKLSLVPVSRRGSTETANSQAGRKARPFKVPHLATVAEVFADDVQGVRTFGSEDATEAVADKVNEKLEAERQNHEVTHEYHRIGAVRGIVLDADGSSTVINWFTEFGITETSIDFDITGGNDVPYVKVLAAVRAIETALGGTPFSGIHCICGDQFFDNFVQHSDVKTAYERWQQGEFLRADNRQGFKIFNCTFENYRGQIGDVSFIPTATARFFPVGAPGIFQHVMAPADYIETVNTKGKVIYAKQQPKPMGKGIDIEVQSNPLLMCTRPQCLVEMLDTSS